MALIDLISQPKTIAWAIGLAWFIYLVSIAIYRLYLSPIANFPGPKLAALTLWYDYLIHLVQVKCLLLISIDCD